MKMSEIVPIVDAAEKLQDAANALLLEIDKIENERERMTFRRKWAELIADIEQTFVYEVRKLVD